MFSRGLEASIGRRATDSHLEPLRTTARLVVNPKHKDATSHGIKSETGY